MAISNLDLATYSNFGNVGAIPQNLEPGIPRAVILAPRGTVLPPSAMVSQSAFYAYLTGTTQGTLADTRRARFFPLINLDTFKDDTKKMGSTDTGLNQFDTIKFNTKYSFRYLTDKANHQEVLGFDNGQNQYSAFIVDTNGYVWGTKDPAGTEGYCGFTMAQLRIMDWMAATTSDGLNNYSFMIQFANRAEFNEKFKIFNGGIDPDNIPSLMNAVMQDVSSVLGTPLTITTTTDVVAIMKAGQGSIDLASAAYYQSMLTVACFIATNLTLGTTLTITSLTKGTITVSGQVYNYLWFILSAAPTSGNVVQIALRAPSVVNAIIANFNTVTEIVQPGVDGSNACVHTFA